VNPRNRQMREVIEGRRKMSGFSFDAQGRKVAYVATSVAGRPSSTSPARTAAASASSRASTTR
jgi:hypothetical protein